MLPLLHAQGLVDAVDAFCETIAFSTAQVRRVFEAAHALGLPVKLHAEQLSDSGGRPAWSTATPTSFTVATAPASSRRG